MFVCVCVCVFVYVHGVHKYAEGGEYTGEVLCVYVCLCMYVELRVEYGVHRYAEGSR